MTESICEEKDCVKEGIQCRVIDYMVNPPEEETYYYCAEHCKPNGFCYGCGEFWSGCESFDFRASGLCDNCKDELDSEMAESEDMEDFIY